MFHAVQHGHFDNVVLVIGYVVTRLAMLCQWVRAYHNAPEHRSAIILYIVTLAVAQVLWVGMMFLGHTHLSLTALFASSDS